MPVFSDRLIGPRRPLDGGFGARGRIVFAITVEAMPDDALATVIVHQD